MNDDIDIEETLKRYPSEPGENVKRSVMTRFANTLGTGRAAGRGNGRSTGFWKRPIPLYIAAATVVVAVGLSFFAGQRSSATRPRVDTPAQSTQRPATAAPDVTWEVAPNDVL